MKAHMSSVRGCDKCGRIFFESEENWSTGTGVQFYTDDKGRRTQRDRQEDRCGTCNGAPTTIVPNLGQLQSGSKIDDLEKEELFARLRDQQMDIDILKSQK